MNPYAIPPLVALIVNASLGVYVLSKSHKNIINRIFALIMGAFVIWDLGEVIQAHAVNTVSALMWGKFIYIGIFFVPSLFLYFTLTFQAKKSIFIRNKLVGLIIFIPSFIFLPFLTTNLFIYNAQAYYWGYSSARGPVFPFYLLYYVSFMLLGLIILILSYKHSRSNIKRKQIKSIFIWALIPVFSGAIIELGGPLFDINIFPITSSLTAIASIFVVYAILKYKLFVITPATSAESIIATIPDSLILVNHAGNIVTVNQATCNLLGYKEKEIIGKSVDKIFAPPKGRVAVPSADKIGAGLDRLMKEGFVKDIEMTYLTRDKMELPMSFSGSVIRGVEGKLAGIVYIAKDLTEFKRAEEERIKAEKAASAADKARLEESEKVRKIIEDRAKKLEDSRSAMIYMLRDIDRTSKELAAAAETEKKKATELGKTYKELSEKSERLERFHKVTVGREMEMVKLKDEINSLLEKSGQPKKYEAPEKIQKSKNRK